MQIPIHILEKANHIKDLLNKYNYHYYVLDDPIVPDAVYDKLYHELLSLEKK